MPLRIFKESPVRVPKTSIAELYRMICTAEGCGSRCHDINLVFTTDRNMRTLNRRYRGIDKSTDVLSFCLDDGVKDGCFQGEIYVSVPAAKRQAKSYGATLAEENLRLVCHGLLHLMGYDHERPGDARKMKRLEDLYLSRVD